MLTSKELGKVDAIRSDIDNLERLLDGFTNRHVRTSIGLVAIYDSSSNPNKCDDSGLFANIMKSFIKELNTMTSSKLEVEIKKLKAELSQYISEEK